MLDLIPLIEIGKVVMSPWKHRIWFPFCGNRIHLHHENVSSVGLAYSCIAWQSHGWNSQFFKVDTVSCNDWIFHVIDVHEIKVMIHMWNNIVNFIMKLLSLTIGTFNLTIPIFSLYNDTVKSLQIHLEYGIEKLDDCYSSGLLTTANYARRDRALRRGRCTL